MGPTWRAPAGVGAVGAPAPWASRTRCAKIAVLDTGTPDNHPDLAGNVWHNRGEIQANDVDDDRNGYVDDYLRGRPRVGSRIGRRRQRADASGALVVIPLALAWAQPRAAAWRGRGLVEAVAIIAAVVVVSVITLSGELPLLYAVFPALIWAALRGATLAVVIASGTAVGITAAEVGPFVAQSRAAHDVSGAPSGPGSLTAACPTETAPRR